MRILIAPLNWGLGHATRCAALIDRYLANGDEVVIGGDGPSLTWLRKRYPSLPYIPLAPLTIRYSKSHSQIGAMIRMLPRIIRAALLDHYMLRKLLSSEHFDMVLSDNRFGLFSSKTRCIYMTHQLTIALPHGLRKCEPIAAWLHRAIIKRYAECYVPDYSEASTTFPLGLGGRLSHPHHLPPHTQYIGPLSRFTTLNSEPDSTYHTVVILSGPEPQRSLLENDLIDRYAHTEHQTLIIRGLTHKPPTVLHAGHVTLVPYLDDKHIAAYLRGAKHIVCRSGYSSVMDMAALHVLPKTEWIPTPGQPEQEYLAAYIRTTFENNQPEKAQSSDF